MLEKTKQVNKIVLRDNVLKKVIHAELYKTLREKLQKSYDECEKKYFSSKWIKFAQVNEIGYWNKNNELAVPYSSKYTDYKDTYFGIANTVLTEQMIESLFIKDCPDEIITAIKKSKKVSDGHWIGFGDYSYCLETGQLASWNDNDSAHVGIVKISYSDFKENIRSQKYTVSSYDTFKKSVELLNKRKVTDIKEDEVDKLVKILNFDRNAVEKDVVNKVMNNFTMSAEIIDLYTEGLLACDKTRVDLENYTKKCVEDVNSGHWELWSDGEPVAEKGQVLVTLEKPLIARNPLADIHEDGLIGIDFGTKSTIVSKRDGKEKTTLMRVGIGQLTKEVKSHHYENPTIMEFINLDKFLNDYNLRTGRPETSIDDLRVSHTANNDLKSCAISDEFYSFFYDIKQWCGDTERNVKIKDQKGVERVLPAFINLDRDEFNPLELYAYYLGLYINNMRNGIYLDYILSFPVTYEKSVKEKIVSSFEKGLKKSLPKTVINNEETMCNFRVRAGVSEPAAYAITALQGYGFEPDENEKILYSIFDFGGGTTDFDFGLWRLSDDKIRDERRFDYVIEHFGSEGDKYLGGENLLELMAFEVFKANAKLLGKSKGKTQNKESNSDKDNKEEVKSAGFSFSKPKECDEFAGSETLISDSQEARRNTKQLTEVLRPFWEGIIGIDDTKTKNTTKSDSKDEKTEYENSNKQYCSLKQIAYKGYIFKNTEECKFPINDGCIEIDLFDKDGNRIPKTKLFIENKNEGINIDLIKILENRIERGIQLFFNAVIQVFRSEDAVKSKANEMQIFLAGNSSKSPILKKLFDKYISEKNMSLKKNNNSFEYFHMFPPLGTKEAMKIQKERNVKFDSNNIAAPNGKTGVAYGLIAGRKGGKIKVVSEAEPNAQTKFRYNIGVAKRGNFLIKLDRNKVDYGQWLSFIDASEEDFEIYYTSSPVPQDSVPIDSTGIYCKKCRIDNVNEDADIYIRCVEDSPEDIEYCVSVDEPTDDDIRITRIHLGE